MSINVIKDPHAHCTLCRHFDFELEWKPEKDYPAGSTIELRGDRRRSFNKWKYVRTRMPNADIVFRWKLYPTVSERRTNRNMVIFRAILPYGVKKQKPYHISLTVIPPVMADLNLGLSIWIADIITVNPHTDDIPEYRQEIRSECVLPVYAGPVERVSAYARPMAGNNKKVRVILVPEDRFGNPGEFENNIKAQLMWQNTTSDIELKKQYIIYLDAPDKIERIQVAVPMGALGFQENVSNGKQVKENLVVTGNPVWGLRKHYPPSDEHDRKKARKNGDSRSGDHKQEKSRFLKPTFGEFHWHTDFSGDGKRPIRKALESARDCMNMDFTAPGDHNPQGKNWEDTIKALDEFNKDEDFATFFGWENGTRHGHENIYFTDPDHPLVCGGPAGFCGGLPDESREIYAQYDDFLLIPHHTNSVSETRKLDDDTPMWHPYPWNKPFKNVRLVEIMQTRGNQERDNYTDAWKGWHQGNCSSAQDALERGYHLGFVGGTDNHCAWPGRAYAAHEGGLIHGPKSVILTGVWTEKNTRQGIYDALWQRHTWAVWDTRAIVWFQINERIMGDELVVKEGDNLAVYIEISAEDAVQSLEIISERETVWVSSFPNPDIEVMISLGQAQKPTHFYLRGLQRDGGIFYSSPIFVTLKED